MLNEEIGEYEENQKSLT